MTTDAGSIVLGVGDADALFGEDAGAGSAEPLQIVDPHEAVVSPFDFAVTRGDGMFEATVVWDGYAVSLENHLKRLAHTAAMIDMPAPNLPAFERAVEQLVDEYADPERGPIMRILVSRGPDRATGIGAAAPDQPHVWMFLDAKAALHNDAPITMTTLSRGYTSDVAERAPWLLCGAKTLSYAVNQSAHRECARRGVDDSVFVTDDGYVLECPNATIVARYGDEFVTPDPSIGILHGTTQRELFAWARQEGKSFSYARRMPVERLREADALYMTHGGWVIPVRSLDGRDFAVDQTQADAINAAIHAGRTRADALGIGPDNS